MGLFQGSDHDLLSLGVVGCGYMGGIHAQNLADLQGVNVEAVCDVDQEVGGAVAYEVGGDLYTDPETMFSEVSLDGVVIATPPFVRREVIEPAVRHGLALYIEKPPAVRREEAVACARLLDESDIVSVMGFIYRIHPLIAALKEVMREVRVSQVRTLFTTDVDVDSGDSPLRYQYPPETWDPILSDAFIHAFDLIRDVIGQAKNVGVLAGRRVADHVEPASMKDTMMIASSFESGILGVHQFSAVTPDFRFEVEIVGLNAFLTLDLVNLRLQGEVDGRPVEESLSSLDLYALAMEDFRDLLVDEGHETRLIDYSESLSTLAMVEASHEALNSGQWREVGVFP